MVKRPQTHLRANVLSHRYERNSKNRERLDRRILLQLLILTPILVLHVVVAVVEHLLHFQHITRASVRAHIYENARLLRDGMRIDLEDLDCSV